MERDQGENLAILLIGWSLTAITQFHGYYLNLIFTSMSLEIRDGWDDLFCKGFEWCD